MHLCVCTHAHQWANEHVHVCVHMCIGMCECECCCDCSDRLLGCVCVCVVHVCAAVIVLTGCSLPQCVSRGELLVSLSACVCACVCTCGTCVCLCVFCCDCSDTLFSLQCVSRGELPVSLCACVCVLVCVHVLNVCVCVCLFVCVLLWLSWRAVLSAVCEPGGAAGVSVLPARHTQAECGGAEGQTPAQDGHHRPVRQWVSHKLKTRGGKSRSRKVLPSILFTWTY